MAWLGSRMSPSGVLLPVIQVPQLWEQSPIDQRPLAASRPAGSSAPRELLPAGPGTQNCLLGLWSGAGPTSPDTPTRPPDEDDAQPFAPQCRAWGLAQDNMGGSGGQQCEPGQMHAVPDGPHPEPRWAAVSREPARGPSGGQEKYERWGPSWVPGGPSIIPGLLVRGGGSEPEKTW